MEKKVITTKDGSHSLFIPDLNEHYHSVHGAMQESRHVFIKNGLHFCAGKSNKINLLEMGLGTGLNVLLTCLEAIKNEIEVHYTAVEKFPVEQHMLRQLNYAGLLGEGTEQLFHDIHSAPWNQWMKLSPWFHFKKIIADIGDIALENKAGLIYYDAFAPRVQPELWGLDSMKKMHGCLKRDGILVTYCSKGSVKRALRDAGFKVETLAGPPGKREMTRAVRVFF